MTDQNLEARMREMGEQLAKEAHCRYCDRWQGTPHPAERCKGDVEGMAEEITKALLSVAREMADIQAKAVLSVTEELAGIQDWNEWIKLKKELAQARADLERAQARIREMESSTGR